MAGVANDNFLINDVLNCVTFPKNRKVRIAYNMILHSKDENRTILNILKSMTYVFQYMCKDI